MINLIYTLVITIILIFVLYLSLCVFRKIEYKIDRIILNPKQQIAYLFTAIFVIFLILILIKDTISTDGNPTDIFRLYSSFTQSSYFEYENILLQILFVVTSFIGAIIFSGLLISTLTNSILCRIDRINRGTIRYHNLKNHDVILGANEITVSTIKFLVKKNKNNKILIVSNKNKNVILNTLCVLENDIRDRVIIYKDNVLDIDYLKILRLDKCNRIVILGDKDIINGDTENIYLLSKIENNIKNTKVKRNPIPVYISYRDDYLILNYCRDASSDYIHIYPFNHYRLFGDLIWGFGQLYSKIESVKKNTTIKSTYPAIPRVFDNKKYCSNIIILGFNAMAAELLESIYNTAHFTGYNEKTDTGKTLVSIISDNNSFIERYDMCHPFINQINDVECKFIQYGINSSRCLYTLKAIAERYNDRMQLVVCSEDFTNNIEIARHLPYIYYEKNIPVLIYSEHYNPYSHPKDNFGKLLENFMFFGFKDTYVDFEGALKCAQAIKYIHSENKHLIEDDTDADRFKSLNEKAFRHWFGENKISKQIDHPKQVNIAFINALFNMLDSMGLELKYREFKQTSVNEDLRTVLKETEPLLKTEEFYCTFHRQYIAWNILKGYSLSDNQTDDFKLKRLSFLCPLSNIKNREKRISYIDNFIEDIIIWLTLNNLVLTQKKK